MFFNANPVIDVKGLEKEIRNMASGVINAVGNVHDHPSFGYTKTGCRNARERMEGAIGLYMVITEQANHSGFPANVAFLETETTIKVLEARSMVQAL